MWSTCLGSILKKCGNHTKNCLLVHKHGIKWHEVCLEFQLIAYRAALEECFDHIELVDVMDSNDAENLALLKRPELGMTFTKLHCWRLTQYEKAVFMDADTLVRSERD